MSSARTTVVRPADPTLRAALRLAFLFAAIKLAIHVAANLWEAHIGYGYFRDEFYYIACGRHLAWGYVDHGPIVALQARLSELIFGRSLAGLRFLSALGGAGRVFLTGILAWALGGRRPAQGLAMLGVLLVPQYLGTDSYLSMNSCESLFWMTCLLALILILKNESDANSQKLWLLFGISGGIGVLNKPSMTFFLVALLIALIVTPQRRILFTKWAAIGTAILILIALPNLLWQIHNHWPTLEFLRNGQLGNKSIKLSPLGFTIKQVLNMGPFLAFIWIAGLVRLLRRPQERWLGLTFVFFFLIMMLEHAKDYYVSPIYPVLFAAGGIAWETRFAHRRWVKQDRAIAFPIYATILIVGAIFILPLSLPLMPPAQWLAYTHATGLDHITTNSETNSSGPLPQFFADRFGWQEEVEQIQHVFDSLPPEQQKITGIVTENYGEAGAVDFLGHNLPPALSGQNNYFLWGPHGYNGDSIIVVERTTREHLLNFFDHVEVVGHMGTTYSMPFEHKTIFLCTGRKLDADGHRFSLLEQWPSKKDFF
jgi:hypothetical protein